jgi:tRNA A-37 threonylcarbamoyl transferase component Bud32
MPKTYDGDEIAEIHDGNDIIRPDTCTNNIVLCRRRVQI